MADLRRQLRRLMETGRVFKMEQSKRTLREVVEALRTMPEFGKNERRNIIEKGVFRQIVRYNFWAALESSRGILAEILPFKPDYDSRYFNHIVETAQVQRYLFNPNKFTRPSFLSSDRDIACFGLETV